MRARHRNQILIGFPVRWTASACGPLDDPGTPAPQRDAHGTGVAGQSVSLITLAVCHRAEPQRILGRVGACGSNHVMCLVLCQPGNDVWRAISPMRASRPVDVTRIIIESR